MTLFVLWRLALVLVLVDDLWSLNSAMAGDSQLLVTPFGWPVLLTVVFGACVSFLEVYVAGLCVDEAYSQRTLGSLTTVALATVAYIIWIHVYLPGMFGLGWQTFAVFVASGGAMALVLALLMGVGPKSLRHSSRISLGLTSEDKLAFFIYPPVAAPADHVKTS